MGKKKKKNQKAADATLPGIFKSKFLYTHQDVICKSWPGEKASKADISNAFCRKRQFPFFIIKYNKKKETSHHQKNLNNSEHWHETGFFKCSRII